MGYLASAVLLLLAAFYSGISHAHLNTLIFHTGGGGVWTLKGHTVQAGAGAASTTTPAINTTGANLVWVVVSDLQSNPVGTLTDFAGNSWGAPVYTTNVSSGTRNLVWYKFSPTTNAADTFTYTASATAYACVAVMAWAGSNGTADQHNTNSTAGTSIALGSITPTHNNELLLSSLTIDGVISAQSINNGTIADFANFNSGQSYGCADAYYNQTSAAAVNQTWSWTTSVDAGGAVVSFPHS